MKILIVDDEEEIRWTLSSILEDEGYETSAVSDGFSALESLRLGKFDAVVTDLILPGMDGMEILGKIREDYPQVIVIMITGHESVETAVEAMKAGADDYIPKPIEAEELLMRLAKAIELRRLKYENQLFHQRLSAEIDTARKIQRSLLPQQPPSLDGLSISIFNQPAEQVGGDYHDLIELPSDKLGIAVGDVSGKGMPAALLMANVQASLRRYSESAYPPEEIISRINSSLCPICQFIEEHRFVTLFYGVLSLEDGELIYSNAGHNYPIIFRRDGSIYKLSDGAGLPCGIMGNASYDSAQIELRPGDIALFYTDGITEALNPDDMMFTEDRLINIVMENLELDSTRIVNLIREELKRFTNSAYQYDDMTLVVVKYQR